MKIALIGYGKMGKTIERIAIERGHEIVARIDSDNMADFDKVKDADVAIEFTRPESAVSNLSKCFDLGVPVVCGTTGWLAEYDNVVAACKNANGAFFYASNYSLGVNIFFEINRRLAALMNTTPQYDVKMTEVHHTQKLDAPSGTAITLAKDILANISRKKAWICNEEGTPADLVITAERTDPAPGTHIVTYDSAVDTIEITHTAHSREGFALGAVMAAEWIKGKKGVFSMRDLLGF